MTFHELFLNVLVSAGILLMTLLATVPLWLQHDAS